MNERERWIVYPLLFLALGAALRDKMFDQTTTRRIVCQELVVVDEAPVGREAVWLAKIGRLDSPSSGKPPSGYLVVNGQLSVAGTVDAQNYAVQGVPLALSVRAMIADLLQALQKSTQGLQRTIPLKTKPTTSEPSADRAPATETPAPENAPQSEPSN